MQKNTHLFIRQHEVFDDDTFIDEKMLDMKTSQREDNESNIISKQKPRESVDKISKEIIESEDWESK